MKRKATPAKQNGWQSRIIGHREVSPKRLKANPANWRTHPQFQRDALMGALSEVGWVQGVIVNRTTGHIIDGHARVDEAIKRKEETVPVTYVKLTEEEERLVLATFDPIGAMAKTNSDQLQSLLGQVASEPLNDLLENLGKTVAIKDPQPKIDKQAEIIEKWKPETGQIWNIGQHRLMIGDASEPSCWQQLLDGDTVDGICSDPPYDMDVVTVDRCCRPLGETAILLLGDKQLTELSRYWYFRWLVVWHHRGTLFGGFGNPSICHTVIGCFSRQPKTRIGWRRPKSSWPSVFTLGDGYYAQSGDDSFGYGKPVSIFDRMLEGFRKWKVVADPFCGSGASILAAEGRKMACRGMELAPETAALALQRCSDAGLKPVKYCK